MTTIKSHRRLYQKSAKAGSVCWKAYRNIRQVMEAPLRAIRSRKSVTSVLFPSNQKSLPTSSPSPFFSSHSDLQSCSRALGHTHATFRQIRANSPCRRSLLAKPLTRLKTIRVHLLLHDIHIYRLPDRSTWIWTAHTSQYIRSCTCASTQGRMRSVEGTRNIADRRAYDYLRETRR